MKFIPHSYQRYAIERIISDPALGLFLDMGLGKTVITLTAVSDLRVQPLGGLTVPGGGAQEGGRGHLEP